MLRISRWSFISLFLLVGLLLAVGLIGTAQAAQETLPPTLEALAENTDRVAFPVLSHDIFLPMVVKNYSPMLATALEINPGGVLLTAVGDSQQLTATAYNGGGSIISAPVSWSSDDPAAVSVSSDGLATALAASGSTIVRAHSGDAHASILIVIADPVDGAFLLSDSQITSDPYPLDPLAPQGVGFQYTVTLDVPAMPSIGQMVINTGEKPVGGKTIAVVDSILTLEIVDLNSLFNNFSLNQHFTTADMRPSLPISVTQVFNVQVSGDTLLLTLKPGVVLSGTSGAAGQAWPTSADLSNEFDLGPFKCKTEATGVGVELSKADISFQHNLSGDFIWEDGQKLISVTGQPELHLAVTPEVKAELAGKLSCKLEFYEFTLPAPGVFGWLVAGKIPVGLGFEAEAKAPLASLTKIEISTWQRAEFEAGFNCQTDCVPISQFTNVTPTSPDGSPLSVKFSGPQVEHAKIEASLSTYLYVELNAGASLVKEGTRIAGVVFKEFEFMTAQAGLKLEGKFTSGEVQAHDPAFNSEYSLSFEAAVGPGETLETALNVLNLVSGVNLEWDYSKKLGISPIASVASDLQVFNAGDSIHITVTLVPSSTEFPLIGYNLNGVKIYKIIPGILPADLPTLLPVSAQLASTGQLVFNFVIVASEDGVISDYIAFAEPKLMSFVLLELGVPQSGYEVLIIEGAVEAYDLNNQGQALVSIYDPSTFTGYFALWNNGELRPYRINLDPTLYGMEDGFLTDLNDQGLMGGRLLKKIPYINNGFPMTATAQVAHTWFDDNGNYIIETAEINDLSALSGNPDFKQMERSYLRDLNNIGAGTGYANFMYFDSCSVPGSWWHFQFPALFHASGLPTDLGHFFPDMCNWPSGEGWAINDQSEVLAVMWNSLVREKYGVKRSSGWLELPSPANVSYAEPYLGADINDTGMAVGTFRTNTGGYIGAIWYYSDTLSSSSVTISNTIAVFPQFVNDAGQVAMTASDASATFFYLWQDDNANQTFDEAELRDLQALLPQGMLLNKLVAMDEHGCILVRLADGRIAILMPKGRLSP